MLDCVCYIVYFILLWTFSFCFRDSAATFRPTYLPLLCAFPARSASLSLSSSHHINIISMTISTLLYVQNTKIYHTLRSAFLDIHLSTSHSSLLSSYLFLCQLLSYHLAQAQFKDPFTLSLHIHIILCMCLCFLILHFSYAQYDT